MVVDEAVDEVEEDAAVDEEEDAGEADPIVAKEAGTL